MLKSVIISTIPRFVCPFKPNGIINSCCQPWSLPLLMSLSSQLWEKSYWFIQMAKNVFPIFFCHVTPSNRPVTKKYRFNWKCVFLFSVCCSFLMVFWMCLREYKMWIFNFNSDAVAGCVKLILLILCVCFFLLLYDFFIIFYIEVRTMRFACQNIIFHFLYTIGGMEREHIKSCLNFCVCFVAALMVEWVLILF